jgi:DNA-directed RNA polymerase specialized sigma24 family protein
MALSCLLGPVLSLVVLRAIASFAVPMRAEIPDGVVRYVTKAVAARARRSGFHAATEEDLFQEIMAKLWEREPDLAAWASFSNRAFDDPAYKKFHDLLISTVRAVLDRASRTRRIEGRAEEAAGASLADHGAGSLASAEVAPSTAGVSEAAQTGRVRHYAPPDRMLTNSESDRLPSREPGGHLLDLMLDVQKATASLPPPSGEVVTRKLVYRQSWTLIAETLALPVPEVRRLFDQAFARLALALKGYGSRDA